MRAICLTVAAFLLAAQAQRGASLAARPLETPCPVDGEESAETVAPWSLDSACLDERPTDGPEPPHRPSMRVARRALDAPAALRRGHVAPRARRGHLLARRSGRDPSDEAFSGNS